MLTLSQWAIRVSEVYSMTRSSKLHHSQYLELLQKYVYNRLTKEMPSGQPHYNQFVQGYVLGLIEAHREMLWKEFEFCYWYEDQLYSTGKEPSIHKKIEEIYTQNLWKVLKDGHHYWRGTHAKFN